MSPDATTETRILAQDVDALRMAARRWAGLALAVSLLSASQAQAESADYELVATLVSPCIFGADRGDMRGSTALLPVKEGDDPRGLGRASGQTVWRFATDPGELYISVAPNKPHTCTLTAFGVRTLTANAALMRHFGKPAELNVGASIHEVFKTRSGGRLTVDLWPNADPQSPSVVATYVSAGPPPA